MSIGCDRSTSCVHAERRTQPTRQASPQETFLHTRTPDELPVRARFLAEKGEGVHHIAVAPTNYDQALADQAKKGSKAVLCGTFSGFRVAYLPTERDLGVILEIFSPPAAEQKPDAT